MRKPKCAGNPDMNEWMILDCNYLCYRAFFAMGELRTGDLGTGVLYGVLKDISGLNIRWKPKGFIFCWDAGYAGRSEIFPDYKKKRRDKELTDDEKVALGSFRKQCRILRVEILPQLFKNVWREQGFESDDLMAWAAENLPEGDRGILVTADKDLFQCISPTVDFLNLKTGEPFTNEDFRDQYGIEVTDWITMKALAGCSSDGVPGIPGVGEKTAIKYIRKELKPHLKVYKTIEDSGDIYRRNLSLVRLPFPFTPAQRMEPDEIDGEAWRRICSEYDMPSIDDLTKGRKRGEKRKRKLL